MGSPIVGWIFAAVVLAVILIGAWKMFKGGWGPGGSDGGNDQNGAFKRTHPGTLTAEAGTGEFRFRVNFFALKVEAAFTPATSGGPSCPPPTLDKCSINIESADDDSTWIVIKWDTTSDRTINYKVLG